MFGSASSIVKAVLWLANIALALFIAAMTVTPQMAAQNIATWLGLLGLKSGASWFAVHAAHRVHVARPEITEMSRALCTPPCHHAGSSSSPGFEVPEIVFYALGALLLSLVVIWLLRRRAPTLSVCLYRVCWTDGRRRRSTAAAWSAQSLTTSRPTSPW